MNRLALVVACILVLTGCGWFRAKEPDLPPRPRSAVPLPSSPPPPVAAGQVVVDRVMAIVNQDVITLSELQEAIAFHLRETRQSRPATEEEARAIEARVLQRLIEHRLQVQEARREKLEVVDEELREAIDEVVRRSGLSQVDFERDLRNQGLSWEAFRREFRDQLLVQRVVRRKVAARVSVTEGEVDDYLRANREKFEAVLSYRARHIAVLAVPPDREESWERARERIAEIRRRLAGGTPFAEVARQLSEDPTADQGGDVGVLRRGELAPLFERAILALDAGEVSEPIRSPHGLHLFLLEEREELTGEALARARSQAREVIQRQKFQERLGAWLEDVKRRAIIAIKLEQKS